jgi:aryl-alcohol dehydrogenase-like predicted oxidoreductase
MLYRTLGSQLNVSAIGFGCMGLNFAYESHDERESIATIHEAIDKGVTFFDTADMYADGANEQLLGRALGAQRKRVVIASKFGFKKQADGSYTIDGSKAYVRQAVERSLTNLGTDYIDLYYLHRLDKKTSIEETMEALTDLVQEGKILHIGLSEVSAETIRRAHAVHPITAVQTEYSLLFRDAEELFPTLEELGIGFVPYAPFARGFLTGRFTTADELPEGDFRRSIPRFNGEAAQHNAQLVAALRELATQKGCTMGQLCLAWALAQRPYVVPIPGIGNRRHLADNIAAVDVTLTASELQQLNDRFAPANIQGDRYDAFDTALVEQP